MGRKPRVPRSGSILGSQKPLNASFPSAYHIEMEEIAVSCGFGSKTEVVRNAIIMMHAAVEAAKAGKQIAAIGEDGVATPLYGTVFEIIRRAVKESPPTKSI